MTWRNEFRTCTCGVEFTPKREGQRHCSATCRVAAHRRSVTKKRYTPVSEPPTGSRPPSTPYFNPHGPTPGALQGDDVQVEYYEDGYPKQPACLDRRQKKNPRCETGAKKGKEMQRVHKRADAARQGGAA